jgi:membrane-bound lytic murein transglycosylase B
MTSMRRTCLALAGAFLVVAMPAGAVQDPPRQSPPAQNPPKPVPDPAKPVPDPAKPAPDPAKPALAPQESPKVPFDEWLAAMRAEAKSKGISDATLDAALADLQPDPYVIERDRAQPELTQTLDDYITARMTTKLLTKAADVAVQSQTLLAKVETAYGVPAPVMVAIWGIESNFGQITGTRSTIRSLATLAYDARRALFRTELFEAFRIIDRGLVTKDDLKGSWAGAIGQPQFMPSSFLKHAVDFDGDGRIDLWTSEADVLGSMAEYLSAAGWTKGGRWGREVRVSQTVLDGIDQQVPMRTTGCRAMREMTRPQPLTAWTSLGVTLADGTPLPTAEMDASLVRGVHRHFLVYHNYEALLGYNCSNAYAVSAGLIADAVAAKKN